MCPITTTTNVTAIPEMDCFCFSAFKLAKSALFGTSGQMNRPVLIYKRGIYIAKHVISLKGLH